MLPRSVIECVFTSEQEETAMSSATGLLGRKVGMTQVFNEQGDRVGVTVVEAGPCTVLQVKSPTKREKGKPDGYHALQLGFGEKKEKRTSKPLAGHFAKAGASPKRFVREIRLQEEAEDQVGEAVTVEIFKDVRKVDVQGVSKGKGFAGTIKRWNFHRQPASHGNSRNHRTSGGLGRQMSVNKGVPKGKKMAGHLGSETTTVQGLKLFKVDPEHNLLLIQGSVPGANGSLLIVRKSLQEKVRLDKKARKK